MNDAIAALGDIPLYRGVDPARPSITRLGGQSNRSFRIAGPVGVHVLRLAGAAADTIVDRRAEAPFADPAPHLPEVGAAEGIPIEDPCRFRLDEVRGVAQRAASAERPVFPRIEQIQAVVA